jgi:NADH-quinone oxidoreductase subunit G
MPQLTIDGKNYQYEGSPMLLQYAIDNGIEIPYFCYHPAMSAPTNCRMCLVEVGWPVKDRETGQIKLDDKGEPVVNWGRKPNTACNTPITPDMIVRTHKTSAAVHTMQKGVLEYMLVNHPLDCPICDQAGECPLQIWTYKYGPEGSRFEDLKVHKPKRVELGPNVILDAERCINCTRCVRFTEEISKSDQLSIVGRGEKNYPSTAPGQSFTDPYSMNTIDLCPVGALTSKHFRFKARVWEMAYGPSIDMNDATGTNIDVWIRDNKVLRITPRENRAVNDFWMPDAHRLNISRYNDNRVSGAYRHGKAEELGAAYTVAARMLAEQKRKDSQAGTLLLGSAYASVESNWALKQLAKQLGVETVYYIPHVEQGFGDGWLISDDRTPNSAGCEMLGLTAITLTEILPKLKSGEVNFLYALENNRLFSHLPAGVLANMHSIVHATNWTEAHQEATVLLPAATSIEAEGIYVNQKGMPQASRMIKQIARMTPDMWMRIPKGRLDKAGVAVDNWRSADNIFDVQPSWLMIAELAKIIGDNWGFAGHADIVAKIKAEYEQLADLKISYKIPKEAFKITQFDFALR